MQLDRAMLFIIIQRKNFPEDSSAVLKLEMIVLLHTKIHSQFIELEKSQYIMIGLLDPCPRDSVFEILEVLVVRDHRKRESQIIQLDRAKLFIIIQRKTFHRDSSAVL